MLSYRHGFHAGNRADVHKHAVYVAALRQLLQKPKPLVAIDLYAGHAMYDLASTEAAKTREHETGIGRLLARPSADASLADYIDLVRAANGPGSMTRYPGSPELARRLLRADDCLIVNELHPAEAKLLRRWAAVDTKIRVHQRDAVEAVKALLPPRVRRGIVLIDPPYEVKTEYDSIAAALPAAVAR